MTATKTTPQQSREPSETMALEKIDELAEQYGIEATAGLKPFQRAIQIARGVQALRGMLTPAVMKDIMALQGSYLGFRTDKDSQGGYPADTVKEVFIEATLRGFPTGCNCWNIIAGRFYATKEGYEYKVGRIAGLTDIKPILAVPKAVSGGATVDCRVTFKLNGYADSLERTFPIRVNSGMSADAILGKAMRKLLKALHDYVLGSEHSIPDPEEQTVPNALPPVIRQTVPESNAENGKTKTPEPTPEAEGEIVPATGAQHAEINQLLADKGVVVRTWREEWQKGHNGREPRFMTAEEADIEIEKLRDLGSSGG